MSAGSLICVECLVLAGDQARGWQAHLADVDDDGELDVVLYCSVCAAGEFGDTSPATHRRSLAKYLQNTRI